MMDVGIETRRKQALFRAQRRGTKELDLIFGAFAAAHLAELDAKQLDSFEELLAVPDWQIYRWVMGKEEVPQRYDTEIFARLRDYRVNLKP